MEIGVSYPTLNVQNVLPFRLSYHPIKTLAFRRESQLASPVAPSPPAAEL